MLHCFSPVLVQTGLLLHAIRLRGKATSNSHKLLPSGANNINHHIVSVLVLIVLATCTQIPWNGWILHTTWFRSDDGWTKMMTLFSLNVTSLLLPLIAFLVFALRSLSLKQAWIDFFRGSPELPRGGEHGIRKLSKLQIYCLQENSPTLLRRLKLVNSFRSHTSSGNSSRRPSCASVHGTQAPGVQIINPGNPLDPPVLVKDGKIVSVMHHGIAAMPRRKSSAAMLELEVKRPPPARLRPSSSADFLGPFRVRPSTSTVRQASSSQSLRYPGSSYRDQQSASPKSSRSTVSARSDDGKKQWSMREKTTNSQLSSRFENRSVNFKVLEKPNLTGHCSAPVSGGYKSLDVAKGKARSKSDSYQATPRQNSAEHFKFPVLSPILPARHLSPDIDRLCVESPGLETTFEDLASPIDISTYKSSKYLEDKRSIVSPLSDCDSLKNSSSIFEAAEEKECRENSEVSAADPLLYSSVTILETPVPYLVI